MRKYLDEKDIPVHYDRPSAQDLINQSRSEEYREREYQQEFTDQNLELIDFILEQ